MTSTNFNILICKLWMAIHVLHDSGDNYKWHVNCMIQNRPSTMKISWGSTKWFQVSHKSGPLVFWISWTKIINFFLMDLIESWQTLFYLVKWRQYRRKSIQLSFTLIILSKRKDFLQHQQQKKEAHNPRK